MKILFTKHADEKFEILERHGILIAKDLVERIVRNPRAIDYSRKPLLIAQGSFNKRLVLRVVYSQAQDTIKIITFYPGRKEQYEKNI